MIFLTGLAGSGKTTVGRRLGAKLGWRFMDTDAIVERKTRMRVAEIFEKKGEREFRRLESLVLSSLGKKRAVVATGGGMVLKAANRLWMKRHGVVVYLSISPKAIVARLKPADFARRPLLGRGIASLRELQKKRAVLYAQADLKVQAAQAPAEVVAELLAKIKEKMPLILHDKTAR